MQLHEKHCGSGLAGLWTRKPTSGRTQSLVGGRTCTGDTRATAHEDDRARGGKTASPTFARACREPCRGESLQRTKMPGTNSKTLSPNSEETRFLEDLSQKQDCVRALLCLACALVGHGLTQSLKWAMLHDVCGNAKKHAKMVSQLPLASQREL